jgi:hypothetical protein
MAFGKTLNAANLEALGAAALAELLIEISKGDAAAQRRLRLALAGRAGSAEAARAVLQRLASINRAKTRLGWRKIKPFAAELEAQRRAILDLIAPTDPREAFDLMWRLVGCAESVFARTDDGSGRLAAGFHDAARDIGPLAARAGLTADELAGLTFRALSADRAGVWGELVPIVSPQLGRSGLMAVRELMQAWLAEPVTVAAARERRHTVTAVLQQIADALGDVDAYIEQIAEPARRLPAAAAAIARRLLEAGRVPEAWSAVEAVEVRTRGEAPMEWDTVRIDVLEALGRADDAQAFRWQRFKTTLDVDHLRLYLRKLPDFDDFDAEERALTHALSFGDVHRALAFLVAWPDLRRASELVLSRAKTLNGDLYELMNSAADALETRYPLAATVLRRAVIGVTLRLARSSRYKVAARQFEDCRSAAARIESFDGVMGHAEFEGALRAAHGRKAGFWLEVNRLAAG